MLTLNPSREASASAQPAIAAPAAKPSHTGAIAGGAVGGIAAIAILVALLMWYCKRNTSASRQHMQESRVPPEKPTPMYPDGTVVGPFNQDHKQAPIHGRLWGFPKVTLS